MDFCFFIGLKLIAQAGCKIIGFGKVGFQGEIQLHFFKDSV